MRSVLALSLSLALTGVLLAMNVTLRRAAGPPAGVEPERRTAVTTQLVAQPVPASAPVPLPVAPPPFHWRAVESPDYAVYTANLRAIGCPETALRDLLLADIEKHYSERVSALEDDKEDTFWQNADERDARTRARAGQLRALELEKRALIRQLLGRELSFKALQELREHGFASALAEILLGFTDLAKSDHLVTIHHLREDDVKAHLTLTEGILLDEDIAALRTLRDRFEAELAERLLPTELEELRYRLAAAADVGAIQQKHGVQIAGAELREVARLRADTRDLLAQAIQLDEHIYPDATRQQGDAACEELLRRFLGAERYADVTRARDNLFVELFQSTAQLGVPKTAVVEAHAARRMAEEQARQIRADEKLSGEERAILLATLRAATTASLARSLGPVGFPAYVKSHGQGLTNALSLPVQRRRDAAP